MKFILTILTTVLIVFGASKNTIAQKKAKEYVPEKCEVSGKVGGKYELLFADRHEPSRQPVLIILVKIKPKNINREYLLEFAKRIRQEYCNENNLIAVIYDDKKHAYYAATLEFAGKREVNGSYRGSYGLFKDEKIEGIRFSTKRGNSIDEIQIEYKDGEPTSNRFTKDN